MFVFGWDELDSNIGRADVGWVGGEQAQWFNVNVVGGTGVARVRGQFL